MNICRADTINYSVVEKSKKDDSPTATTETISWTITQESFKTRETWNNYKDAINCQVKIKDIQKEIYFNSQDSNVVVTTNPFNRFFAT